MKDKQDHAQNMFEKMFTTYSEDGRVAYPHQSATISRKQVVDLVNQARQEEREKVLDEVNSVLDSLLVEDEFYGKSIAEIQVEMIVNMIKNMKNMPKNNKSRIAAL